MLCAVAYENLNTKNKKNKNFLKHGQGILKYTKGDCREILQQIDMSKIKLLLTDPPYGIGYNR